MSLATSSFALTRAMPRLQVNDSDSLADADHDAFDRATNPFGGGAGFLRARVGQDDHELVAAVATAEIHLPRVGGDDLADFAEGFVARSDDRMNR